MSRFAKWLEQSKLGSCLLERLLQRCEPKATLIPRGLKFDMAMERSRKQRQSRVHIAPEPSQDSQALDRRSTVNAAIKAGNQDMLRAMFNQSWELIESHDRDGLTPLSYAAYHGHVAMVEFFLQNYPSSISVRNKDTSYPIHTACQGGHIEVLNKMYSYSPKSFTWTDKFGQTILHVAAKAPKNKLKNVVSYLVNLRDQEMSRNLIVMRDENLNTPLKLAQDCKNYEVVNIIRPKIG